MTDGRRRVLHVATMIAILGAFWWNQERGLKAVATETHSALCSFKKDLAIRHANGEKYLEEIKGPMIFGIPRDVIEQSVKNQKATLDSLKGLDCGA